MREIKFRAWDTCNKKYLYLEGCSLWFPFSYTGNAIAPAWIEKKVPHLLDVPGERIFRADVGQNKQWLLEQFTGLLDKNGKEIYEGDVVRRHYGRPDDELYIDVIEDIRTDCEFDEEAVLEVIGNVHSNQELLTR